MLNNGPHITDTVRFRDNVLNWMQRHQQKEAGQAAQIGDL
jgi:hypothetical protein